MFKNSLVYGIFDRTALELAEKIAVKTGLSQADAKVALQATLDAIIEELADGNRLEFRDFGIWEVRERAGRQAHNPKTFEKVTVPPKKTVKFRAGRLMKLAMQNEPTRKA